MSTTSCTDRLTLLGRSGIPLCAERNVMPMSVGFSVRHRAVINRAESRPRPWLAPLDQPPDTETDGPCVINAIESRP
jgi:hypothetical protein